MGEMRNFTHFKFKLLTLECYIFAFDCHRIMLMVSIEIRELTFDNQGPDYERILRLKYVHK